jgi:hypothetical protein
MYVWVGGSNTAREKIHREKSNMSIALSSILHALRTDSLISFDLTHCWDHGQLKSVGFVSHWPQERTRWLRNQCCGSGSGAFLTSRSGMEKIQSQDPCSGIRDEHPRSYFWEVSYQFSGFWDPRWKNRIRHPGSRIRDPQPGTQYIATIHWRFSRTFWTNKSVTIPHKLITVKLFFSLKIFHRTHFYFLFLCLSPISG